jgi:hypothetical protein
MKFSNVSIRQFARELEVNDRLIRKAIEAGSIKNAIHYKGDRISGINKYHASWEWLNNSPSSESFKKLHLVQRLEDFAAEWEASKPDSNAKETKPAAQPKQPETDLEGLSGSEIRERQELLKMEKLQLEVDEKKGLLIEASKVSESMYNFGSQVKAQILAVPDRIIDDLLASDSRADAYFKLQKALSEALESLANSGLK